MVYSNYQLPVNTYPQDSATPGTYPTASTNYYEDNTSPQSSSSQTTGSNFDPYGYHTAPSPNQAYGYNYSPPPATSDALVPSYGPPPSQPILPPMPVTPPQAPEESPDIDPSLAAIIASQERAMQEAKERNRNLPASSNASALVPRPTEYKQDPFLAETQRNSTKLSDAVHPQKQHMKAERKTKTAAGAAGGAVIGGLMFGPAFPVGMVLGGAVGGYASNKISKSGERRAQRGFEQANFQKYAQKSHVQDAAYV